VAQACGKALQVKVERDFAIDFVTFGGLPPAAERSTIMNDQKYLDRLARSGLFPHPERLTLEFERSQRRLLSAFRRAMRAGPPPCPHCGRTITAEDLGAHHRVTKGTEREI
jgi:hypothetical protein